MNSPKRILVTGVAGFIGSNLAVRLINEGYHVVGIDDLSYGVREQVPAGMEFHQLDIRDRAMYPIFENADAVFHLAAKNCIADCQKDPLETSDINVTGTVNVFEASRRAGVRKVIYAESSALYEGTDVLPTPECAIAPQSFYAVSKLAGMAFADAYRRFYDLQTTALRYFCVFGPRQDYRRSIPPVMSAFIIAMLQGKAPTIFGSGDKRRDFIYVDDVNDFHLQCLTDDRTTGNVYNLGSGTNNSINDIFRIVADVLQTSVTPRYSGDMPGEAQETLADISAASNLGWEPKVTLREGIIRSVEFIRSEIQQGRVVLHA